MNKRRKTREVRIGGVTIGGDCPTAIQSMTVSDTNDVPASIDEVVRLAEAGAAIVRLTVPSMKAAKAMAKIRSGVRHRGCLVPLVADIHYTPNAALMVASVVEKVRINPGNYVDRPDRVVAEESFESGAARVAESFGKLLDELKKTDTALRIGVNHGSLSERMTGRYGDTPEGMVASAIEYIEVCERLRFHDVVVSLKSSIPGVMVEAYRLFVDNVDRAGWNIPVHVGVTEAGMGEEGLLRSASGIGTLLMEGIGDTIRVSLTGDPVQEIPAAREILKIATQLREDRTEAGPAVRAGDRDVSPVAIGPISVGGNSPVAVLSLPAGRESGAAGLEERGDSGVVDPDLVLVEDAARCAEWHAAGKGVVFQADDPRKIPELLAMGADGVVFDFPVGGEEIWRRAGEAISTSPAVPIIQLSGVKSSDDLAGKIESLLRIMPDAFNRGAVIGARGSSLTDLVPALENVLSAKKLDWVQMLSWEGSAGRLSAVMELSPPLLAGAGGLLFSRPSARGESDPAVAWQVLQATRRRITHVEYISCPSCGRTLFDLEEVTTRIRERTSHLKDVKIAVMGCIVNGPGEMADADFGYVGSGPGKIDLYVGKDQVSRNVPEGESVERLIELIRERGAWIDP